jgi:hypothetical protein
LRRLAELQIRIAAQGAQAAARRIYQYAVDLAGEAFALTSFLRNQLWLQIVGPERFRRGFKLAVRFRHIRHSLPCEFIMAPSIMFYAALAQKSTTICCFMQPEINNWLPSSCTSNLRLQTSGSC